MTAVSDVKKPSCCGYEEILDLVDGNLSLFWKRTSVIYFFRRNEQHLAAEIVSIGLVCVLDIEAKQCPSEGDGHCAIA